MDLVRVVTSVLQGLDAWYDYRRNMFVLRFILYLKLLQSIEFVIYQLLGFVIVPHVAL
jgi:hypothetical protein